MHHLYKWLAGVRSSFDSAAAVSPTRSRSTAETLNSRLNTRRLRLGIEFSPGELFLVFVSHFWGALQSFPPVFLPVLSCFSSCSFCFVSIAFFIAIAITYIVFLQIFAL
jgi:hypothetical protein